MSRPRPRPTRAAAGGVSRGRKQSFTRPRIVSSQPGPESRRAGRGCPACPLGHWACCDLLGDCSQKSCGRGWDLAAGTCASGPGRGSGVGRDFSDSGQLCEGQFCGGQLRCPRPREASAASLSKIETSLTVPGLHPALFFFTVLNAIAFFQRENKFFQLIFSLFPALHCLP